MGEKQVLWVWVRGLAEAGQMAPFAARAICVGDAKTIGKILEAETEEGVDNGVPFRYFRAIAEPEDEKQKARALRKLRSATGAKYPDVEIVGPTWIPEPVWRLKVFWVALSFWGNRIGSCDGRWPFFNADRINWLTAWSVAKGLCEPI